MWLFVKHHRKFVYKLLGEFAAVNFFTRMYASEIDWPVILRYLRYLSFYGTSSCLNMCLPEGEFWKLLNTASWEILSTLHDRLNFFQVRTSVLVQVATPLGVKQMSIKELGLAAKALSQYVLYVVSLSLLCWQSVVAVACAKLGWVLKRTLFRKAHRSYRERDVSRSQHSEKMGFLRLN